MTLAVQQNGPGELPHGLDHISLGRWQWAYGTGLRCRATRAATASDISMDHGQEIFNRHEAAAFLRVSVAQVDNWSRAGSLTRVKVGSGPRARVLYRRADLMAFIDGHVDKAGL